MHDFRVASAGKFEKVAMIDPNCCVESVENGQTKCCKSSTQAKSGQMVESKLSQVLLGVVADSSGRQQKATRYTKTDPLNKWVKQHYSGVDINPKCIYESGSLSVCISPTPPLAIICSA